MSIDLDKFVWYNKIMKKELSNKKFTHVLFYHYIDGGLLDSELIKIKVSKILKNVFKDVEFFKIGNENINISKKFGKEYKYLGQIFSEKFNESSWSKYGMYNKFLNGHDVLTVAGFKIYLYDDAFITLKDDENVIVKDLMLPKYQKRYVKELTKMFGIKYKMHYHKLLKFNQSKTDLEM